MIGPLWQFSGPLEMFFDQPDISPDNERHEVLGLHLADAIMVIAIGPGIAEQERKLHAPQPELVSDVPHLRPGHVDILRWTSTLWQNRAAASSGSWPRYVMLTAPGCARMLNSRVKLQE